MSNGFVVDTPEGISRFRLLSLRGRLKFEAMGMKGRVSTLKQVRAEFGIKARTAKEVLPIFEKMLLEAGVISTLTNMEDIK